MKGFRFTAWLSTAIVCFLFWMLLTWSFAPRELILGGIVSVIVAAFACRFFIHSRAFYLYNPVRLILLVFYCVIIFFWEIIKANVSMAKLVLSGWRTSGTSIRCMRRWSMTGSNQTRPGEEWNDGE